jgi:hypothetical protein
MNRRLKNEIKEAIEALESDPPTAEVVREPEPGPDEEVDLAAPEIVTPQSVCRKCGQRFLRSTFIHPFLCPVCAPPDGK